MKRMTFLRGEKRAAVRGELKIRSTVFGRLWITLEISTLNKMIDSDTTQQFIFHH